MEAVRPAPSHGCVMHLNVTSPVTLNLLKAWLDRTGPYSILGFKEVCLKGFKKNNSFNNNTESLFCNQWMIPVLHMLHKAGHDLSNLTLTEVFPWCNRNTYELWYILKLPPHHVEFKKRIRNPGSLLLKCYHTQRFTQTSSKGELLRDVRVFD